MTVSEEIKNAVADLVVSRFSDDKIASVSVQPGEDSDGDPVLNILVVFEAEAGRDTLDGKKMSGLARRLIAKLSEMNFDAFPLVSFVSTKDAKKLNLEAA